MTRAEARSANKLRGRIGEGFGIEEDWGIEGIEGIEGLGD